MSGTALLGDIGGTNARFAVCRPGGRPGETLLRRAADFPALEDAIADVLAEAGSAVDQAVLAVAGPVDNGMAQFSNSPWRADADALARRFGWTACRLVNDFAANALALPLLGAGELEPIGGGHIRATAPKVALGPGTGLGVAGLVPSDNGWIAVPGEGGHAGLAAGDDYEAELLAILRRERGGHVACEDALCGPGLMALYRAVVEVAGPAVTAWTRQYPHTPAEVGRIASEEPGGPAGQAITVFSRMLGAYAGDLALIYGAHGGVYLTGGVLPALGVLFDRQAFRQRFEAKGDFSAYVAAIPSFLVTAPQPGLLGLTTLIERA